MVKWTQCYSILFGYEANAEQRSYHRRHSINVISLLASPVGAASLTSLPPASSLQTYARFTGAPLKMHKITNPWRSPSGTQCPRRGGKKGAFGEGAGDRATDKDEVPIREGGQLRVWCADFFFNVRSSACPSDQSRRGHLSATQDHHPPSKRGRWLGEGDRWSKSSVSSVQPIY